MKTYKFFWLGRQSEPEILQGESPADALNRAGYGGGAVRALDYYEEVKDNSTTEPKSE